MAKIPGMRKTLSAPGLLKEVRACFDCIEDPITSRGLNQTDCLMSGLAVFGMKYPSLLKFDEAAHYNEAVLSNLETLYGVSRVPSDTAMRERLDEVDPRQLRHCFTKLFQLLQRGKELEGYTYLNGHYVLSIDGTGYFSSDKVHCQNCCEKHRRDGTTTYYHQMLGAVLVRRKEVFPFAPEPILKKDGARKNDCERNAATRLLEDVRREHPHLKLIVVEDGLASNGPHINLLKRLDLRFILGAKPGDHKFLFEWVNSAPSVEHQEFTDENDIRHEFRYLNGVPLNDTHFDLEVNFLEYWEKRPNGRKQRFSWVTDLPINEENAMQLMRAGRARWKIENETFNTLKNQGYCFEHNFGHGEKNLSTVFAFLMMLAFLIDQIQQRCCKLFRQAQMEARRSSYFREKVRGLFLNYFLKDWETLYGMIAFGHRQAVGIPYDTS